MDDPLWTGTVNAIGHLRASLESLSVLTATVATPLREKLAEEIARAHKAADEAVRSHIRAWRAHVDSLSIPDPVPVDLTADTQPNTKGPT